MGKARLTRLLLALPLSPLLTGCLAGPNYHRPSVETPTAFKEAQGWAPARPANGVDRGDWWSVFGDPLLDRLERQVEVSNQNLAAALAAYKEAHAVVDQDRAALFPTVLLTASASRSRPGGGSASTTTATVGGATVATNGASNAYQVALGGSWAPDVWGQIRREIEGAKASAQAEAADYADAKLSAQSELAADYLELRLTDAEKAVMQASADAYAHALQVSRAQYQAGTVSNATYLTAVAALASAQASLVNLDAQRAESEHAIAMLIGKPPADLTIPVDPNWSPTPPETPNALPSALLQRRPDIAAAERTAAAANAQIGVQVAAFYPNITLSASGGFAGSAAGSLFNASNLLWSVGADAAQTVFNGGLTGALVRGAKASRDEQFANYRQTVLAAFQQVEDDLAAARVLQTEEPLDRRAWQASDGAAKAALDEYNAGTVDFTTVATAQVTALSARETLLTLQVQRMTTEISLIEALGGGWSTSRLPKS